MIKKEYMYKIYSLVAILQILLNVPIPIFIFVDTPLKGSTSETPFIVPIITSNSHIEDSDSPLLSADNSWIPFILGASPGTTFEVIPKSRDTMGLCVDSNFYGMYNYTININGTLYNQIKIPNAGLSPIVGNPAVPMTTSFLEIPHGVNINFKILYNTSQVAEGYNIIPSQEPPEDFPNATVPPFTINTSTYLTNQFYPLKIASIEGQNMDSPIIIRGHRVLILTLFPVQFNPITQQVITYSKIEVRLNYNRPAQIGSIPRRLLSPAFESLCEGLLLNYRYRHDFGEDFNTKYISKSNQGYDLSMSSNEQGAEYLIITNDTFYQQIRPLAKWKEQKGLKTKIVKTSEIKATRPTANEIYDFIQDAYDTWDPAPSYVLLVGDSDHILPHYRNIHPSPVHGGFRIPTDLYYATVEGSDYFPDIYVGRISVDTPAEVTTIVNKILDYERNPPALPAFYSHIAACAYFQDYEPGSPAWPMTDNNEDRWFVRTSEDILDFLNNSLNYDVDRIYNSDNFANPLRYHDGTNIPNELLRANGYPWDDDRFDVINNITAGSFLVYHRDHGGSRNFWNHLPTGQNFGVIEGWGDPRFETGDITAFLANGQLLPVVLSIECQCGWYDGEIDQETWGGNDAALTNNFESFAEVFVRHQNGGAVATIAASRNSRSGYNDELLKGMIDATWPGFNPTFASGGLFRLGQILTYGKIYMSGFYGYNDDFTNRTFELFQLFGDPELSIWTSEPRVMDVDHPTSVGSLGSQQFVVNVTDFDTNAPIHHAKVCLQKNSDIYEVCYTDPLGYAYFNINPSSGGNMNITVTHHNYTHYENSITVTDGGAIINVEPMSGPIGLSITLTGSYFLGNEIIDIDFGGIAMVSTASGGTFSETFDVPDGSIGPLNIIASGRNSGRIGVTYFRRLGVGVDLYIYSQWDDTTWDLNPDGAGYDENPRWDNPCIQLYDQTTFASVPSNDLEVNKTYTIRATIYNRAPEDAIGTVITFKWAFWGAGQKDWNLIGTDTITVPAAIAIVNWIPGMAVAEADWSPSRTGHTCLMVSISHILDINLDDNDGQENTDVHPVSSPGKIEFRISNPTNTTGLVYLEVRQIGMTDDIWATVIERDYPQVLQPDETQTVNLIVEAPEWAEENEIRTFVVDAFIHGEYIGGVEIAVKKKPPSEPFIIIIIIIGSVGIFMLGVVLIIRRYKKTRK